MNIYITRKVPQLAIDMLKAKGYQVEVGEKTTPLNKEELIALAESQKYNAFLTILTDVIDEDFIKAAGPNLKIISNYAIGFNNIDVACANKNGVMVTNTAGVSCDCVSEHAVALVFALTTRLVEGDKFVRSGKYTGWDPMIFIGSDVCGKTIGLLGAGHIGERFAQHMTRGFDAKIVYYDVKRNERMEKELGATYFDNVEEVLKCSDIVSLHVPLLPTTQHLMNAERLSMMKKSAILINTSRGPVVDENALVTALRDGVIRGAGLDVYEFEPKLADGLAELNNVVLTPHIASARESARNEMAAVAAQNIIDCLEGKEPVGLVKLV